MLALVSTLVLDQAHNTSEGALYPHHLNIVLTCFNPSFLSSSLNIIVFSSVEFVFYRLQDSVIASFPTFSFLHSWVKIV